MDCDTLKEILAELKKLNDSVRQLLCLQKIKPKK